MNFQSLFEISAFGLAVQLGIARKPDKDISAGLEVYDFVVREILVVASIYPSLTPREVLSYVACCRNTF